jgi:hypothetical protein
MRRRGSRFETVTVNSVSVKWDFLKQKERYVSPSEGYLRVSEFMHGLCRIMANHVQSIEHQE